RQCSRLRVRVRGTDALGEGVRHVPDLPRPPQRAFAAMKDVFLSHVEEDADVALALALELERSGYSTWCYELDSVPGPTYFQQTRGAVVEAKVMVVVISPRSLGSQQIERELVRAFELRKAFIPILRDITHTEFQERQPEWADILGAAASVRIPAEGIVALAPRVCEG